MATADPTSAAGGHRDKAKFQAHSEMSMGNLRQRQNMSGMGPIIYIQSTSNMVNNFKTPAQYHNNSYLPDHI
jgi:hypothetical protein